MIDEIFVDNFAGGGGAEFIGNSRTIKCKHCGGAFICTNPLTSTLDVAQAWNMRIDHPTEKGGNSDA